MHCFALFYFMVLIFVVVSQRKHTRKGKKYRTRRTRPRDEQDDIVDSAPFYNIIKQSTHAYVTEPIPIQQRLLNTALTKFNSFNNGFYMFQIEQTCNCPICDIQSMNIYIEDNIVVNTEYSEGNDYALNSFCDNNNIQYNQRLLHAKITIYDLFNMIQDTIINNINIGVLYHEIIGIPLSISIEPLNNELLSTFIAINCIKLNPSYPSPVDPFAADYAKRARKYNRFFPYNTMETMPTIIQFNANNPYSCQNIIVPEQCVGGMESIDEYFSCFRITDGCNTCSCDSTSHIIGCTTRVCHTEIKTDITCIDCESNTAWSECGGPMDCIPNCDSVDHLCGLGSSECSTPKCQCPFNIPIWNGIRCMTQSECDIQNENNNNTNTNNTTIIAFNVTDIPEIHVTNNGICIPHCNIYNDGCLQCTCDDNGQIIGECIHNHIGELCTFEDKQCVLCEDPTTMFYTECGTVDITCDTMDTFIEFTQCIEKCQCQPEFPIYDPIHKICIPADQCYDEPVHTTEISTDPDTDTNTDTDNNGFGRCIEHCPVYYDGCNACQCPGVTGNSNGDETADFCTNLECSDGSIGSASRTCFRCETDPMEYVMCGKCDRTCQNPIPLCLDSEQCLEKCQCPLHAPIYEDGRCIAFQQCEITPLQADYSGNDVDNSYDEIQSHNKIRDEDVLHTQGDHEQSIHKYQYNYGEVVLYVIIIIICIVSGISLLFWPKLILQRWRINRQNSERIMGYMDDDMDIDNDDDDDAINLEDVTPLPYKPDGTIVINNQLP